MGTIRCEVTTDRFRSEVFTVEVKSKDGKAYQKKSSFQLAQEGGNHQAQKVVINVDYGDVITVTEGSGSIFLTDPSVREHTGRRFEMSVKKNAVDNRVIKELKITKESLRRPPEPIYKPVPKDKIVTGRRSAQDG